MDAPNIKQYERVLNQSGAVSSMTNYLELNNRLIEEVYLVSKRREHVQLHLGDSDLTILDIDEHGGYSNAMEIIRNRKHENNSDGSS